MVAGSRSHGGGQPAKYICRCGRVIADASYGGRDSGFFTAGDHTGVHAEPLSVHPPYEVRRRSPSRPVFQIGETLSHLVACDARVAERVARRILFALVRAGRLDEPDDRSRKTQQSASQVLKRDPVPVEHLRHIG
jgi:hypothetical protein